MVWNVLLATALLGLLAGVAQAAEVDNPAYAAWAKQKVGTAVTIQITNTSSMPGAPQQPPMQMTDTLASVSPTEVVLDSTVIMNGKPVNGTRQTHVPAKVDKDKLYANATQGMKGKMTTSNEKDGTDTIDVMGKPIECKTHEMDYSMDMAMGQQTMTITGHMKVWSSDTVPGGMVQTQMHSKMMGFDRDTTLKVVSVKPAG